MTIRPRTGIASPLSSIFGQVRRGDGSVGSMTFDEISEILTLLAAQHATEYGITPVVISREAVRRWWRHLRPGQPVRESRGARAKRLGDSHRRHGWRDRRRL